MRYCCSKKVLFIFLFFVLSACTEERISEIDKVKNIGKGRLDNILLINIFGGTFPLPSRFSIEDFDGSSLLLSSKRFYDFDKTELNKNKYFGRIHIGKRKECDFCDGKVSDENIYKVDNMPDEKYFKVIKVYFSGMPNKYQLILFNDEEYMSIMDENEKLWITAIDVFNDLKSKK